MSGHPKNIHDQEPWFPVDMIVDILVNVPRQEHTVPARGKLDMLDYNVFDRWVASHDVSDHTVELLESLADLYEAMQGLLPPEKSGKVLAALQELDADAWAHAYGTHDRMQLTQGRSPRDFFRESLCEINNLNFEVGAFAHVLYCYASGGMVEPAKSDTPLEVQKALIEQWITRGTQVATTIPDALNPMPLFRLIVAGAGARWALDNERPITGDQLAALSALARHPGQSAVPAYERVRKTVQNLVAEALGRTEPKTLDVKPDRTITATSAISWLREQTPDYFPSTWLLDEDGPGQDEAAEFVLVPVARAYQHIDARPFTPNARCEEGYEIGASPTVVADYWEALDRLRCMVKPRFRHPLVNPLLGSLLCDERWIRVPKTQIERQLEDISASDEEALDGPTLTFVSLIEQDSRFRPHTKGHSRKLRRYESVRTGKALAVEGRKGAPVIYVARKDLEGDAGILAKGRILGSSPTGRNSNLNSIPTFKNEELFAFRPAATADLESVLDHIAAVEA
jgi:hypothetical protein